MYVNYTIYIYIYLCFFSDVTSIVCSHGVSIRDEMLFFVWLFALQRSSVSGWDPSNSLSQTKTYRSDLLQCPSRSSHPRKPGFCFRWSLCSPLGNRFYISQFLKPVQNTHGPSSPLLAGQHHGRHRVWWTWHWLARGARGNWSQLQSDLTHVPLASPHPVTVVCVFNSSSSCKKKQNALLKGNFDPSMKHFVAWNCPACRYMFDTQ